MTDKAKGLSEAAQKQLTSLAVESIMLAQQANCVSGVPADPMKVARALDRIETRVDAGKRELGKSNQE